MQPPVPTPLDHFLSGCGAERVWAQVLIHREGAGFVLRHHLDRGTDGNALTPVDVAGLRAIAESDAAGGFRPHRLAPDLPRGWRCAVPDAAGLREALDRLYPGSIEDWAALVLGRVRPVEFATVAARQLGRSKVLQQLRGRSLEATIDTTCTATSCLKHRRWTAAGVPPDDGFGKSAIPCLEPCPMFLGFARACAEADAQPTVEAALPLLEWATVVAALRHALARPPSGIRAGDFAEPLHPKRVARLLARHADGWVRRAGDGALQESGPT